jgi:hypothetical protein
MLLIASPDEEVKGSMDITFLNYTTQGEDNPDEKLRGNRAKHLGRVAAEYTQLLYHVRKARSEHCVFVEQIQWRIDRVRSTLSSDLDQLFTQTVLLLADSKGGNRGSELEKSKWIADLTECLRTYDILGLWRDAEDVIRQEVVRNFVKKVLRLPIFNDRKLSSLDDIPRCPYGSPFAHCSSYAHSHCWPWTLDFRQISASNTMHTVHGVCPQTTCSTEFG